MRLASGSRLERLRVFGRDVKTAFAFSVACLALLLSGSVAANSPVVAGMWKQAFDAGHAGIYTISIAEIFDLAEKDVAGTAAGTVNGAGAKLVGGVCRVEGGIAMTR